MMGEPGALCRILAEAQGEVGDDAGMVVAASALRFGAADAAARLRAAGLAPDEPVLVSVANRPADLAALFAVW